MTGSRRSYRLNPRIRPGMLYDMCQDPDWWPHLDLIATHPAAWPQLRAWIGRVQAAGSVESEPLPPAPPEDTTSLIGRLLAPRTMPQPPDTTDDGADPIQMNPLEREDNPIRMPEPNAPIGEEHASAASRTAHGRAIAMMAGIVAATLLLGGGAAVWRTASQRRAADALRQAASSCAQARDDADTAIRAWDKLEKQARALHDSSQGTVTDERTRAALEKALQGAAGETPNCPANGINAIQEASRANTRSAQDLQQRTETLRSAMDAVTVSQNAKRTADARNALDKSITAARTLYESSKDKVSDNKTRNTLKQRLDEARQSKDATDVKRITAARDALERARKSVEDSMRAKEDADRRAEEEQASQSTPEQPPVPQPVQPQVTPVQPAPRRTAPTSPSAPSAVPAPTPSWNVPAPSGDGTLSETDPGL